MCKTAEAAIKTVFGYYMLVHIQGSFPKDGRTATLPSYKFLYAAGDWIPPVNHPTIIIIALSFRAFRLFSSRLWKGEYRIQNVQICRGSDRNGLRFLSFGFISSGSQGMAAFQARIGRVTRECVKRRDECFILTTFNLVMALSHHSFPCLATGVESPHVIRAPLLRQAFRYGSGKRRRKNRERKESADWTRIHREERQLTTGEIRMSWGVWEKEGAWQGIRDWNMGITSQNKREFSARKDIACLTYPNENFVHGRTVERRTWGPMFEVYDKELLWNYSNHMTETSNSVLKRTETARGFEDVMNGAHIILENSEARVRMVELLIQTIFDCLTDMGNIVREKWELFKNITFHKKNRNKERVENVMNGAYISLFHRMAGVCVITWEKL